MRRIYKEYHVYCDGENGNCLVSLYDYSGELAVSIEERDEQLRSNGWKNIEGHDYCPKCLKSIQDGEGR